MNPSSKMSSKKVRGSNGSSSKLLTKKLLGDHGDELEQQPQRLGAREGQVAGHGRVLKARGVRPALKHRNACIRRHFRYVRAIPKGCFAREVAQPPFDRLP